MLRIHFTSADLARTQVAEEPDPMWEIVLSLHMLTARYGRLAFAEWRSQVRADLRRHNLVKTARMLASIAPDGRYFPDFLTPPEGLLGVDAGIEAVVETLHTRIRGELEILQKHAGTPSWAWALTERTPRARKELGAMLRGYYQRAVGPYWATIRERAAVDRAVRTRVLRTEGITALLDNFRPNMRWQSPVLEINSFLDRDLHLQGRGLLLIPSQFCWSGPIPFYDPGLPPVLVYPIKHDPLWIGRTAPDGIAPADHSLAKLLGATRAAILQATTAGPNTTEIARRLDISRAVVSQHTAVLRAADLITSHRHGNNMLHVITRLGLALLRGAAREARPRGSVPLSGGHGPDTSADDPAPADG